MATYLDMSLDDMIKNRTNSESGRRRGRTRQGRGQGRGTSSNGRQGRMLLPRGPTGVSARPSHYSIAKSTSRTKDFTWQHDLFEDSLRAVGLPGIETDTKLYVSNLEHGVTSEDIRELFSEIGILKRYAVHYDRNGRSSGSAEVVFSKRTDALAAVKRYNNVLLDGKAMKIEIIGTKIEMPVSARVNVIGGANGRGRKRTVVITPGQGRARRSSIINRGSGSNRGGFQTGRGRGRSRGRGRGRGRKQPVDKSADELDKELEKYHTEAMQTS